MCTETGSLFMLSSERADARHSCRNGHVTESVALFIC